MPKVTHPVQYHKNESVNVTYFSAKLGK